MLFVGAKYSPSAGSMTLSGDGEDRIRVVFVYLLLRLYNYL